MVATFDSVEVAARRAALEAELKALPRAPRALTLRVSAKGAVSVYGMGRFPVTLYRSQWEQLIGIVPELQAFIAANASSLAVKGATDEG